MTCGSAQCCSLLSSLQKLPTSLSKVLVTFYCKIFHSWESFFHFNNINLLNPPYGSRFKVTFKDQNIFNYQHNVDLYNVKIFIALYVLSMLLSQSLTIASSISNDKNANSSTTIYLITLIIEWLLYCKLWGQLFVTIMVSFPNTLNFNCLKSQPPTDGATAAAVRTVTDKKSESTVFASHCLGPRAKYSQKL